MEIIITAISFVMIIIIGYFIGNISFARIIAKQKGIDITSLGSKNPGGTNVGRVIGKKEGIKVMVYDIFKTAIPCFILNLILSFAPIDFLEYDSLKELMISVLGLSICIGHAYPIIYKFKGGKCVACTAGYILANMPIIFIFIILSFLIVLKINKKLSVASLVAAFLSLVSIIPSILIDVFVDNDPNAFNGGLYFGPNFNYHITYITFILLSSMSLLIYVRHLSNIKRIINHSEEETKFKKD